MTDRAGRTARSDEVARVGGSVEGLLGGVEFGAR